MRLLRSIARLRFAFVRAWPLMRHANVPLGLKLGTLALALLIVSPLDVFADVPILGVLDDAVLLGLLATIFVWAAQRLLAHETHATAPVRARVAQRLMLS
jgi:uncharacterized membrane protein YkvA (DUF1232 family)